MHLKRILVAAALAGGVSTGANATVIGLDLVIGGNTNTPTFLVTNTSDMFDLTDFTFTIGDTSRNFDFIFEEVSHPGGSFTLSSPDNINEGLRSDLIDITFTDFNPGETSEFGTDIDLGLDNSFENYRTVFLNNGALPNSIATALFSNGSSLALELPDVDIQLGMRFLTFSASQNVSAVPLPAALPMMASVIGLFGFLGWRRRQA